MEPSERSNLPDRFAGKVALVTGAASGIGRATAVMLAQQGTKVLVADLDKPEADRTSSTISQHGGTGLVLKLDVTSEIAWQDALRLIEKEWGGLHILVNCAGIASVNPIADTTLDQWRRVMAVNLDGVFLGTRTAIAAMRRAGHGVIVNV